MNFNALGSDRYHAVAVLGVCLLALLLLAAPRAWAQPVLPIQLDLDHAAFAYDSGEAMVEVYLAFEAVTLPFLAQESGYNATLPVDLSLLRSTDALLPGTPVDPVWEDSLSLSFAVADTAGLGEGQHFLHQVRLTSPPGEYELQVVIPGDAGAGRPEMMLRRDVLISDYLGSSGVSLSDITLASSIEQSQARDDLFYKNGLVIRPNANQLFGSGLNQLFYYAESYGADSVADDNGQYTVFAYIAEANRPQPLENLQRRSARPARTPDVLVGTFDLSSLPSGSYFLRIALLNSENEAVSEQTRKFFVYNPAVAREEPLALETTFETSEYATMPEEEVEKAFNHIRVIATDTERRRLRDIEDLMERRRYLMEFWNKRNPNPGTPTNAFKEDFYQRLQYANDRYTSGRREGWRTDRGNIILRFGLPSAIEPHLYDRGFEPYEIWQYNNIPGEGQAQFIFADLDGFGDFQLLHSTVTGERKTPNWLQEVQKL